MNRFIYSCHLFARCFWRPILFLFILLLPSSSLYAGNYQQDIDSIQSLLRYAKGIKKAYLLGRLSGLYQMKDTAKSFNYFRKAVLICEYNNYDNEEFNTFNYLIGHQNGKAQYGQAILLLKKALRFAEAKNLTKAVGFANSAIGREYLMMNNFEAAYNYQEKALQQFTNLGYKYGLAVVYERIGIIFMIKNEFIKALKYYYMALNINRKLKLKHETGISLYHIGLTKLDLSDYREAVSYILQSLKIWDELKEVANQWNTNELLGNIYIKLGDYKKALQYHRKALGIRQKVIFSVTNQGDSIPLTYKLGLAYSYNNIGEVYYHLKKYDSAYFYALKGLKLKTKKPSIASKNDVANSMENLGKIYCAMKKYDSAYIMLMKAATAYKELDNKSAYADALYGLGVLNSNLEKFTTAKKNFLEGLKMAKSVGDRYDVEKGYEHLSVLFSKTEDYRKALFYHKLYMEQKDSIINKENQNKIAVLQIEYNVDKKEREIILQKNIIKQKKKQIFYSILIDILLLVIAIIVIAFVLYSKKQKEKILEKEKENLKKELELKNKDLVCNVSKIFARNKVINHVAHRLINSSEEFKLANRKLIRGIVNELKQNMDETGWKEFDIRFARVHEDFYAKLDKQFPNLTKTERKLCAMLKLGMSSKEIASVTMIRPESVDTARSRLRKKLGLSGDDGLFEFLREL